MVRDRLVGAVKLPAPGTTNGGSGAWCAARLAMAIGIQLTQNLLPRQGGRVAKQDKREMRVGAYIRWVLARLNSRV